MTEVQNGLPNGSGWERKFAENSCKQYYSHKDDPRTKQRELQTALKPNLSTEYNSQAQPHRSPDIRRNSVHPNHSLPPIEAFLSSVPSQETKIISPLKLRGANLLDESVSKIAAMFPTVTETHIRLLLKKYLNREALVISALQVEKHPITTPGPFSTPPPQRNLQEPISRSGSPFIGTRNHSSPKLKLRYMKSIFPHADETIILECLQNNENSIQKTSEKLGEMGYSKKEIVKPVTSVLKPKILDSDQIEKEKSPTVTVRTKSAEEKEKMKQSLKDNYDDVADHLICMALESVNFDEKRARQILKIMKQEDNEAQSKKNLRRNSISDASCTSSEPKCQIPTTQSRQSIKSLLKSDKNTTNRFSRQSDNLCNTQGHNDKLSKGPNDKLLLEHYVQWQGRNKSFAKGPQGLAKGSNQKLLSKKVYTPCGPNSSLRNGAKGSLFTQIKTLIVGEARGD